jgi:hypothetical protein
MIDALRSGAGMMRIWMPRQPGMATVLAEVARLERVSPYKLMMRPSFDPAKHTESNCDPRLRDGCPRCSARTREEANAWCSDPARPWEIERR